jgi:hypothetical protein
MQVEILHITLFLFIKRKNNKNSNMQASFALDYKQENLQKGFARD